MGRAKNKKSKQTSQKQEKEVAKQTVIKNQTGQLKSEKLKKNKNSNRNETSFGLTKSLFIFSFAILLIGIGVMFYNELSYQPKSHVPHFRIITADEETIDSQSNSKPLTTKNSQENVHSSTIAPLEDQKFVDSVQDNKMNFENNFEESETINERDKRKNTVDENISVDQGLQYFIDEKQEPIYNADINDEKIIDSDHVFDNERSLERIENENVVSTINSQKHKKNKKETLRNHEKILYAKQNVASLKNTFLDQSNNQDQNRKYFDNGSSGKKSEYDHEKEEYYKTPTGKVDVKTKIKDEMKHYEKEAILIRDKKQHLNTDDLKELINQKSSHIKISLSEKKLDSDSKSIKNNEFQNYFANAGIPKTKINHDEQLSVDKSDQSLMLSNIEIEESKVNPQHLKIISSPDSDPDEQRHNFDKSSSTKSNADVNLENLSIDEGKVAVPTENGVQTDPILNFELNDSNVDNDDGANHDVGDDDDDNDKDVVDYLSNNIKDMEETTEGVSNKTSENYNATEVSSFTSNASEFISTKVNEENLKEIDVESLSNTLDKSIDSNAAMESTEDKLASKFQEKRNKEKNIDTLEEALQNGVKYLFEEFDDVENEDNLIDRNDFDEDFYDEDIANFDDDFLNERLSTQSIFDDDDDVKEQPYRVEETQIKMIKESEYIPVTDGIRKFTTQIGFGELPTVGDTVTLQCVGYIDQKPPKMFWNTKELGQKPFSFVVGKKQVIKGWDEAVASMKLREKSKFKIEAKKAYGKFGFIAWEIPPNADLIMEFELVDIKRATSKKFSFSRRK